MDLKNKPEKGTKNRHQSTDVWEDILTLQCTTLEKMISETIFGHSKVFYRHCYLEIHVFLLKIGLLPDLEILWDECTHHGPPKKVSCFLGFYFGNVLY